VTNSLLLRRFKPTAGPGDASPGSRIGRALATAGAIALALVVAGSFVALGVFASTNGGRGSSARGYAIPAGSAVLEVRAQQTEPGVAIVDRVVSPEAGWVVIHDDAGGKDGILRGLALVPAGESTRVAVFLANPGKTRQLRVTLHADRGMPETFEYGGGTAGMGGASAMGGAGAMSGVDQPFYINGRELVVVTLLTPGSQAPADGMITPGELPLPHPGR
jgi:hypothetical protein